MAKKKEEKKSKVKEFQFYVLNIKITSDDAITVDTYRGLFENAFNKKQMGKITVEHSGIIRQLFHDKELNCLHGLFCRFLKVGNQAMDIDSLEIVNYEISRNLFPNPKEAQFVFFPDLHRVGIYKNSEISLSSIKKILMGIFNPKDVEQNMAVEVTIEQSIDEFNKILSAKEIRNVHIEISPSNADINKAATAFIDNDLKSSSIGKLATDIQPDSSGKLKIDKGKVLQGMLGLAQSNGRAIATIINEQEKKETINTEEHPSIFKVSSDSVEKARVSLYNTLKKRFRDAKRSS
ncbi:MAG: DUF4747 family protein [Treponema sp.]|nr:DUF4747 family protein [Treponema sp.]